MKIGVIGTGSMGDAIIRKLRTAGHELKIANSRGPESLSEYSIEVGAKAVGIENVVEDVDVVFLVIPNKNLPELPGTLFQKVKPGTVVIDTLNYYPFRDGHIEDLDNGMVESEWVSKLIKYPVVKSFNTMFAHSFILNRPSSGYDPHLAMPVSGDDTKSKEIVAKLIDSIGYNPVDVGSIAESWRQQAGSPVYCTDLTKEEILYWYPMTKRNLLAERREHIVHLYLTWPKDVTLDEQLKAVRNIFRDGLTRH
jgi:predicted dinucleotide-binding enzyme